VSQTGLFNKHERADSRCLQSAIENLKTCPESAKRVEWIENVIVLVVQRVERSFLRAKWRFCRNSLMSSAVSKWLPSNVLNNCSIIPGNQESAHFHPAGWHNGWHKNSFPQNYRIRPRSCFRGFG